MKKTFRNLKKMNSKIRKVNRKVKRSTNNMNKFTSKMRRRREQVNRASQKRKKEIIKHQQKINHLDEIPIDNMDGYQFEYYLESLFKKLGYKAKVTNTSGDFGADLIIITKRGKRIIQAKRYSKKVGVRAIQEISSAKKYYNADNTAVVTNNYFTKQAKELAKINQVLLINRDGLKKLIAKAEKR